MSSHGSASMGAMDAAYARPVYPANLGFPEEGVN